jgi:hypothetical protein
VNWGRAPSRPQFHYSYKPMELQSLVERKVFSSSSDRFLSKSLPAPSPGASGTSEDRLLNLKKPLLYSFAIHFIVILSLILGVYRPDKRPIKEMNYWVVDLVPLINAEPKGVQTSSPESQKFAALAEPPNPKSDVQTSAREEPFPVEVALDPPEPPELLADNLFLGVPNEANRTPSPEALRQAENPLVGMKESLGKQTQMGQYRFMMGTNSQMAAVGIKHFCKNVNQHVLSLLRRSISDEARSALLQKTACVEISYNEEGRIQKISTTSDSDPNFADILKDKIEWNSLSSPAKFGLPHKAVKLRVGIGPDGEFNLNLDLL